MTEPSTIQPHILIVEDDEHIGPLLSFMLERQGYRVDVCTDGRQARQFVEGGTDAPNLVLLDVMLPFHDGFELLGIIRAQAGWQAVPILMLTAKTGEADVARALSLGASDYIQKPFQPLDLMARLDRFMKRGAA